MALVAVVGRPNVGKSSLFNRFIEERAAIIDDQPGVTRDRHYGTVLWNGESFNMVDTGGLVPKGTERFEAAIREQVEVAFAEADVILFVVDVLTGITDLDLEIAQKLREQDKPVLVVVNKCDNTTRNLDASEFYAFGFEELFPISAINGTGTGNLLDRILELLPKTLQDADDNRLRIALIGKPNVGKSSITNEFLGENRSIVTEIAGTTRDAVDAVLKYHGQEIVLVDTAGLRKKAKVTENVEFYSTIRTERAIQQCDVAILILDATQGLEGQDIKVLRQAEQMNKGLVIAVNKWDLIEKDTKTADEFKKGIREKLATLSYIPIVFVSAITRQRLPKLLDTALQVAENRNRRVATSDLNEVMLKAIAAHHPPTYRNQYVRIKYVTQVREAPPVIAFFCNYPQGVQESYRRYLEKHIRNTFNFEGVPLTIVFKKK